MTDPTSLLRSATRRAKSDVANKLVSMFLHEFSRKVSQNWPNKVDGPKYEELVRTLFKNCCPYCSRDLTKTVAVIEHLDGMNRYRAGLHVPGNVVVACKSCNSEKRRDDSLKTLSLAKSGWESFLMHNGGHCDEICRTCVYWKKVWPEEALRRTNLSNNLETLRGFRNNFTELSDLLPSITAVLPTLLTKLYSDCQEFAETEIRSLLQKYEEISVEAP